MYQHIKDVALAQFNANDDQGVVDAMNALSVLKTKDDLQTIRAVRIQLGEDISRKVATGLQVVAGIDPLMAGFWIAISSTGIDVSAQETQDTIDALTAQGIWSTDPAENTSISNLLKGMGRWFVSESSERIGREFTLADVALAREEKSKSDLIAEWTSYQNDLVNLPLANGDRAAVVAALRQAANNLEII